MGCIVRFLSRLGNFLLEDKYCELYLLGAGYFCISVNIFELCSRMQLSYLERV